MKNFKDYEDLIKEIVSEFDEKDPSGWVWCVDEITADCIKVRWGYLTYLDSKNDCFIVTLRKDEEDTWVSSRTPDDEIIDGFFVTENPAKSWETSYETAIKDCLNSIYHIASNNY